MRELSDEEDQRAEFAAQVAVLLRRLLGDGLADLLEQDARLKHLALDVLEQERRADDTAQRPEGGVGPAARGTLITLIRST